jgi:phosphatidylglycerol---prolipoprotein diacylglyceryl transferase
VPFAAQTLRDLAHILLEALAYAVAFRCYVILRRRAGDTLPDATRWTVIAAAAVGAVIGSKLLFWAENPAVTVIHRFDLAYLMGGKTIVGGLLGGLIAVEAIKRAIGERRSSGDLFALPLCVGIAVGRVGCLIAGPADGTWGAATMMAIGVDGGDGVRRHCLPLYEIGWLVVLAMALWRVHGRLSRAGDLFRVFMIGYLAYRLAIEALKDDRSWAGLTAIQWACVAALVYYARDLPRLVSAWRDPPTRPARSIDEGSVA